MTTARLSGGALLLALGLAIPACPVPEAFEMPPEIPEDDDDSAGTVDDDDEHDGFWLESDAFDDGGAIPEEYSCYGADVSVPLTWGKAPAQTRSFALMMTDDVSGDCHCSGLR